MQFVRMMKYLCGGLWRKQGLPMTLPLMKSAFYLALNRNAAQSIQKWTPMGWMVVNKIKIGATFWVLLANLQSGLCTAFDDCLL